MRFRLVDDSGLNFTYVNESIFVDYEHILGYSGNTQDGIEIDCAYDSGWDPIEPDRILLAMIDYVATVTPDSCTALRFAPHPDANSQSIEIQGLDDVWRPPTHIFDLEVVPCGGWCLLVPTKGSTWGAIKTLYRQ